MCRKYKQKKTIFVPISRSVKTCYVHRKKKRNLQQKKAKNNVFHEESPFKNAGKHLLSLKLFSLSIVEVRISLECFKQHDDVVCGHKRNNILDVCCRKKEEGWLGGEKKKMKVFCGE